MKQCWPRCKSLYDVTRPQCVKPLQGPTTPINKRYKNTMRHSFDIYLLKCSFVNNVCWDWGSKFYWKTFLFIISFIIIYFYNDQLNAVVAKIPLSEVLIPGGDWNGHVGRAADGFEEVHGGYGYGVRNDEGGRLLDFAVAHDLVIGNKLFKKRNSHLITYASGVTMRPRLTTSCFVRDCANTFEMLRSSWGRSV